MTPCIAQMRQQLAPVAQPTALHQPVEKPTNPDGSINYGYLDLGEWWNHLPTCGECGRGFVGNSRFASSATERVIPRKPRNAYRQFLSKQRENVYG